MTADGIQEVSGDPIEELQPSVRALLNEVFPASAFEAYGQISPDIGWRPHLLQPEVPCAWYFHPVAPETDTWATRAEAAMEQMPMLRVGVAAQIETLIEGDFLEQCARLNAAIVVLREKRGNLVADEHFASYADFICEERIHLPREEARTVLDMALNRALKEPDDQKKGVLLEVVCALLMSQVEGFETRSKGVSNRSQQMDVLVHSKVASGVLAGSPLVLVEARNWPKSPIAPKHYADFRSKINSRHGRCSLGFLITTGRFTRNVPRERLRDSRGNEIIALVDGKALPKLWRGREGITKAIEDLVVDSLVGE